MGFGLAVIQRLCKTSIKKNLYWEVKDRVFEESFNGIRSVKKTQKVRVYGLDSTREVRARLIEILYDRVAYHKDKFVAPILHHEMQSMEVKKTGKVEHSQNSHDDQVFSYLMALYVWYDGKNLAENFHIMKNTLKTDQDQDIDELDMPDFERCSLLWDGHGMVYELYFRRNRNRTAFRTERLRIAVHIARPCENIFCDEDGRKGKEVLSLT